MTEKMLLEDYCARIKYAEETNSMPIFDGKFVLMKNVHDTDVTFPLADTPADDMWQWLTAYPGEVFGVPEWIYRMSYSWSDEFNDWLVIEGVFGK